jgi:hypothetical protein
MRLNAVAVPAVFATALSLLGTGDVTTPITSQPCPESTLQIVTRPGETVYNGSCKNQNGTVIGSTIIGWRTAAAPHPQPG